jgi:hypothetical protein
MVIGRFGGHFSFTRSSAADSVDPDGKLVL